MINKVLYVLIGVLVITVGVAGYFTVKGGHMGHIMGMQTMQNQQAQTSEQQAQTPEASTQQPQATSQQPQVSGQQPQTTGPNGQQALQAPQAAYPANPTVRVIDPKPYSEKINKAKEIIEDANKMIVVDPFANSGKDMTGSGTDMSKLHQGIYKMSQGVTLMDQTLNDLNKDIGYNYQYPYNQAPGAANQQSQQQNQNQVNNQSMNQMNQSMNQMNQSMNHGAGTMGSFSFVNVLTYLAYGILFASIVGVLVAILGIANSMFKKRGNIQA